MDDWKIPDSVVDSAKADILATVEKYVDLKKHGADEHKGLCPFHSEGTPSFTVNAEKQFYYCFGCGASGNAIDFVMQYENTGFRQAVRSIVGDLAPKAGVAPTPKAEKAQAKAEWKPIVPVPADVKQRPMDTFNRPKGGSWEKLVASRRWEYRDGSGALIGYICRFELPGGGKDVIPQTYCVNVETGETRWRWLSFDKPRPLYGLDKLAAHPAAQVVLAEGEKAADAAQERYEAAGIPRNKLVVISWPGGGKAVPHVDWSPLSGRNVGMWPDADLKRYVDTHPKAGELMPLLEQPGVVCMLDIADRIAGTASSIKIITPPAGVPDGWDLADDLPDGFNLLAHTRANALAVADFRELHAVVEVEAPPVAEAEPLPWEDVGDAEDAALAAGIVPAAAPPARQAPPADGDDDEDLIRNGYFTILGYDRGDYFFFQHEKRQVLSYRKGDFSDAGLMELAPINWWEEQFPNKEGVNKKAAINWVFRTANSRGIYDPNRVRGRGAWTDKGRAVFHHGGYLTVDGVQTDITRIQSAFVYQVERSMPTPAAQPMTDEEGTWLVSVAERIRWSMPGSAALFSGFVMLAPVCGALPWRPHVWITGGAGTGKSTIQNKYMGSLLRGISVYATGDSTEPGIRQYLQADALPVLIDEAESNTERDKQRMENVIGMIRKTSTDSQAMTLKGTVSGDGQSFHIRSMFCLASINVNMSGGKADVDRLTKLVMRPPVDGNTDHWDELSLDLNKIDEDDEIASRLLARALGMMPVILKSVEVFRRAAARHFGTQRQGDQFGTLLAGSWCLQKSYVPSDAEAMVLIRGYRWDEHVEDNDQDDASRAIEALLGAKLRVKSSSGADEHTVYELIRECSPMHRHNLIEPKTADDTLRRHGIRVELATNELWFGTGVSNLVKLVKDMPFVTDLRGQLLRVKGAKRVNGSKKFNGADSKVVSIPVEPILGEEKEQGETDELPI
ncbi:hypothetical protein K32_48400 [Kaistia sp. 32K]|uniref:CHC2 zinc finger domain-containing protein n=1 Tax=Kaistia sp. 32K TaxID=2795690 RepID=UPI0019150897|nr:CHC2 zinc finger domain-containing protein [Kaistia sp. 32K]BCP56223.1 hypothetical protein K32_48400 [Kaistia sp. 32K]